MLTCIMGGVPMIHITNGIPALGGSSITRTGSEFIIRNGISTVIGTISISGMIATGGKRTMPGGREPIIPVGSNQLVWSE